MVELGLKPRLQSSLWEATCKKIALSLVGLQGVNEEHTAIEQFVEHIISNKMAYKTVSGVDGVRGSFTLTRVCQVCIVLEKGPQLCLPLSPFRIP